MNHTYLIHKFGIAERSSKTKESRNTILVEWCLQLEKVLAKIMRTYRVRNIEVMGGCQWATGVGSYSKWLII